MAIAMVSTRQLALLLCNPCAEDHLQSMVSDTIYDENRKGECMQRQRRSFNDLTKVVSPQRDGGLCIEGNTATKMMRPRSSPPGDSCLLGMDDDSDGDSIASRVHAQDDADSDTTSREPAQKLRTTIATTKTSHDDTNVLETAIWRFLKDDAKAGMIPASSLTLAHGRSCAVMQRVREKNFADECDNDARHHLRERHESIQRVRDRSAGMRLSPLRKQKYSRQMEAGS